MWGTRQYMFAAGGVALFLGLVWVLVFWTVDTRSLIFAVAGWAPIALVGVVGGALTVRFHGSVGVAFPLTLAACIMLRLFFGLAGVALASLSGTIAPYLWSLFGTFAVMQVFEMIWFIRRQRWLRANGPAATS